MKKNILKKKEYENCSGTSSKENHCTGRHDMERYTSSYWTSLTKQRRDVFVWSIKTWHFSLYCVRFLICYNINLIMQFHSKVKHGLWHLSGIICKIHCDVLLKDSFLWYLRRLFIPEPHLRDSLSGMWRFYTSFHTSIHQKIIIFHFQ